MQIYTTPPDISKGLRIPEFSPREKNETTGVPTLPTLPIKGGNVPASEGVSSQAVIFRFPSPSPSHGHWHTAIGWNIPKSKRQAQVCGAPVVLRNCPVTLAVRGTKVCLPTRRPKVT